MRRIAVLLLALVALGAACVRPEPVATPGPCPEFPTAAVTQVGAFDGSGPVAQALAAPPASASAIAVASAAPPPPPLPRHPVGEALTDDALRAILDAPRPAIDKGMYAHALRGYEAAFDRVKAGTLGYTEVYKGPYLSERLLARTALDHPDIAALHRIGRTHRALPIPALLLTDQQASTNGKTSVYLNCAHHANEKSTPEFCFRIIQDLLAPERRSLLARHRFWVVPIVNVDGSYQHWYLSQNAGRKNGRRHRSGRWSFTEGVDLNRNYPFLWGRKEDGKNSAKPFKSHYWGPSAGSEPEVQAIMKLARAEQFSLSLSFHTNARAVIYPYAALGATDPTPLIGKELGKVLVRHAATGLRLLDLKKSSTARRQWARKLRKSSRRQRRKLRKANPKLYYRLWHRVYPVYGSDQDWLLHAIGTQALLVEGPAYQPLYPVARKVLDGFMPGFWKLMDAYEAVPRAHLRLRDSVGAPVQAIVHVEEHRTGEGERWTTDYLGRRVVLFDHPGDYTLRVTLLGGDRDGQTNKIPISVGATPETVNLTLTAGGLVRASTPVAAVAR